jgi:uncharacterized protein YodC (DUF2158 family)
VQVEAARIFQVVSAGGVLFEKGKKVQLKGGGPVMTVRRIGNFSPVAADGVDCMWFDERHKRCRAIFQAAALRLIGPAMPSDASHEHKVH